MVYPSYNSSELCSLHSQAIGKVCNYHANVFLAWFLLCIGIRCGCGGGSLVLGEVVHSVARRGSKAPAGRSMCRDPLGAVVLQRLWISGSSLFPKDVFAPCMGVGFELPDKSGMAILAILQGLAYFRGMSATAIMEFPFVQELPKREASRLAGVWDQLRELRALTEQHGQLVPLRMVHLLLDVTPTRVDQLCVAGKLLRFDLGKVAFVTEESIVALAKSERKAGRPFKVHQPTMAECSAIVKGAEK